MTVVVFALPFEAGGWKPPAGVEVCILGVGGQRAAQSLAGRLSMRGERPSRMILAGLAGGLDPGIRVGEVFVIKGGTVSLPGGFPEAKIVTVDRVAGSVREKRKLREESGASLCDMETSHLAAVCDRAGIPWAGLRAVSDAADVELPVPAELLMCPVTGKPPTLRLLAHVGVRPAAWRGFLCMVRNAGRARKCLGAALDTAIRRVAGAH